MQETWARVRSDLTTYHASSADEEVLVKRVEDLLDKAVKSEESLPYRSSMVEIATQLEFIDSKQAASTEARIQREFERAGTRLRTVLALALGSALLLAAGCLVYILRIERQNRRRYEEILKGRKALEQLSARLRDAQETERRAISRELHDQVGQTLNALLVDAGNLAKRIPPDDAIGQRYLDSIRTLADSSVNTIRDIALLLRPSMLDDLGLVPALEWQAREVGRRSGMWIKVDAGRVSEQLPEEHKTCVYRIVQEGLHNIVQHAGAHHASVMVRQEAECLELAITDDGKGFDARHQRGMGLLGIEERVSYLGGTFTVESQPGQGTVLRVKLPVAETI